MGYVISLNSKLHGTEEGFCEHGDTVSGFVEAGDIIMIWMIIKFGNDPVYLENCCIVPCSSRYCCVNYNHQIIWSLEINKKIHNYHQTHENSFKYHLTCLRVISN